MRKKLWGMVGICLLFVFLLGSVYAVLAERSDPIPLTRAGATGKISDIRLMNLGSSDASVTLTFYNTDGSTAATIGPVTLASNQPASWNQAFSPPGLPDGWNGSVVVSSSQPLASIVNEYTIPNLEAASYTGSGSGSDTVYLPAILKNAWSWTTTFAVQNAGSGNTDITVEFRDMSGVLVDTDTYAGVAAGASVYCNQGEDDELGSFFAGSAKITSNPEPVVVVVNEDSTVYDTMAYNGLASGATSLSLPSILKWYFSWSTDIRMMNVGSSSTVATLEFRDLDGNLTYLTTVTLAPNQPWAANQHFDTNLPDVWAGSVRITTDPPQPVVAIVNEVAQDVSYGSGKSMAYSGVSAGGTQYSLPSILKNAWGWFTDIRMMNTTGSQVNVTRTYYNTAGAEVWSDTQPIPAYGVRAYNQLFEGDLGDSFEGSVKLTATGDIAAIVNEVALTDDVSMVYDAIPIAP